MDSEVAEKYGGPYRGRTYGPLIKSDKRPFLTKLAIATVSPIYLAIPRSCRVPFSLSIPFLPFHSDRVWSQKWSHPFQGEGGACLQRVSECRARSRHQISVCKED